MTARGVDHAVAEHARRQYGVFSRLQVLDAGGSDWLIQRRAAAGMWVPLAEGVYALRGFPRSWRGALITAVLATSGPAVVSHESAAALHGIDSFREGPVVLAVRHGRGRLRGLARVHQYDDMLADHITEGDHVPVTTVARTIVDLAAIGRPGRAGYALSDVLSAGKVTVEEVAAVYAAVNRRGKPGMRLVRSLLAQHLPGKAVPASKLERKLLRVLREGGLPRPALQYPFPGRRHGRVCHPGRVLRFTSETQRSRRSPRTRTSCG